MLVYVGIQISARGVRRPWVPLLTTDPAIGVKHGMVVHAWRSEMTSVAGEPTHISFGAQDLGNCDVLLSQRFPLPVRYSGLAGEESARTGIVGNTYAEALSDTILSSENAFRFGVWQAGIPSKIDWPPL